MENNYSINPFLQKKISQNDQKFKLLLNKGLFQTNNEEIKQNNLSEEEDGKFDIEETTKENHNLIKTKEKRMKFIEDKEHKKFITNIFENINCNKKNANSKMKKFNTNEINKVVDRLYNNDYKYKKINTEENKKEGEIQIHKIISNFNKTIERFEEDIKKKHENLNKQKQNEKYINKPILYKGNKICKKIKENFYERQKIFMDQKEKNTERLKNKVIKVKEKFESAPTNKNQKGFEDYLNSLEKWEQDRLDKIEKIKAENEQKIEDEFDFIPKINENSIKIAEKIKFRQKQQNIFVRLSKQDKISKEKKKILIDMYTPSFKPFCYEPKNLNKKKLLKNNLTEGNQVDKDDMIFTKYSNEYSDIYEENEEEVDEFDYKQDIMKFTDKDVENALRENLFHHKKKTTK